VFRRRQTIAEAALPGTRSALVLSQDRRGWVVRMGEGKRGCRRHVQPGSLVVLDRGLRERSRRRIEIELPRDWFPAEDADRGLGLPDDRLTRRGRGPGAGRRRAPHRSHVAR
jgi:hypothetical protein